MTGADDPGTSPSDFVAIMASRIAPDLPLGDVDDQMAVPLGELLDSLQFVELCLLVEEMSGTQVSEHEVLAIASLRDAYDLLLRLRGVAD